LWLQFHHACCDAVAALGFIDQLLREYNSRADRPHDVDRPQVVAHDDATRQVRVDRQVAHRLPRQPWLLAKQKQLARVWKFTRTRPRIVGLPKESLAYPEPFPQFAVTQISNFRRLQRDRDARESQPSVNDHLLAATFAALGDWIRHRGITSEKENLRLAVPMDLRKWMGKTSCFENCVSMIFLDRTLQETLASEPLLRSVAREMKEIKDGQLAGTMLKVLSLMAAFPPLMHRFMKWFTGATTSVVSNLGVVLDANREGMRDQKVEVGGAMLQSIDFLPPLRRGVPLAFGTLTYAGKLSVCLHYDPRVLPRAEATDLLARVWLLLDNEPSRLDMPCGQLR
jgi:NRPS condensation-like uncharacterized protein